MKQLIFAASILFVFQSCEKCSECHYDINGAEVEIGEYCDDDLEEIEDSGFAVGDTTYTVHCHDH